MLKGESKEFFIFDNVRFRQRVQDYYKQIGIKRNVDIYCLRHTFATNLYNLHVPEKR